MKLLLVPWPPVGCEMLRAGQVVGGLSVCLQGMWTMPGFVTLHTIDILGLAVLCGGGVLCTVGCLAASLAPPTRCRYQPPSSGAGGDGGPCTLASLSGLTLYSLEVPPAPTPFLETRLHLPLALLTESSRNFLMGLWSFTG